MKQIAIKDYMELILSPKKILYNKHSPRNKSHLYAIVNVKNRSINRKFSLILNIKQGRNFQIQ